MNRMIKIIAIVGALVLNNAALANGGACKQQIQRFVQTTYTMNQVASVKKVRQANELFWLNPIERKALITHLKLAGLETYGFENGNRHAVSLRTQELAGKNWLVVDVTSDNQMGLTRTIQIYRFEKEKLLPTAVYFDDHFNEPVYRCQQ